MRLQTEPGQIKPSAIRGSVYFLRRANGVTVVAAWPSPRGNNQTPIQRQQVKTWDTAMQLIKLADILDIVQADLDSASTAYYLRDILAMCAFGSYVSWPGKGPYPQGGSSGPLPLPRSGRAARAAAQLGNPHRVNIVTHTKFGHDGSGATVTFTTALPALAPVLLTWDTEPQRIAVAVKRKRKKLPHGKKPWFPQPPTITASSSGGGTSWTYHPPSKGPNGQSPTYYCLVQLGSDSRTGVSWSTTPRQIQGKAVIVSTFTAVNVAVDPAPTEDADWGPADPGTLASDFGWPECNVMDLALDNFPQGRKPEPPYFRGARLFNLGDSAPDYPFSRQVFYSGSLHTLPDGTWFVQSTVNAGATAQPGKLRVQVVSGAADFSIDADYEPVPIGGTVASDETRTVAPPATGSKVVTWLFDDSGITAEIVDVFP